MFQLTALVACGAATTTIGPNFKKIIDSLKIYMTAFVPRMYLYFLCYKSNTHFSNRHIKVYDYLLAVFCFIIIA